MLQLKILRTKKRLSNIIWYLPIIVLSTMGLFLLLSFALRSISMAGKYGLIPVEIPVLSVPIVDPTLSNFQAATSGEIASTTPMVVLTKEEFIFGDVNAFSEEISSVRNKFIVKHVEGSPDINTLVKDIEKWVYARSSKKKITNQGIVILLPTDSIPSPLVVQTIDGLRKTGTFTRVVLAGGLK
ncbi:hypothetical protein [Pseudobacteriovorax antillogorgiicola]|nr:hypothetical protein [Pseudobacteriovorax antillogorgiicola]